MKGVQLSGGQPGFASMHLCIDIAEKLLCVIFLFVKDLYIFKPWPFFGNSCQFLYLFFNRKKKNRSQWVSLQMLFWGLSLLISFSDLSLGSQEDDMMKTDHCINQPLQVLSDNVLCSIKHVGFMCTHDKQRLVGKWIGVCRLLGRGIKILVFSKWTASRVELTFLTIEAVKIHPGISDLWCHKSFHPCSLSTIYSDWFFPRK